MTKSLRALAGALLVCAAFPVSAHAAADPKAEKDVKAVKAVLLQAEKSIVAAAKARSGELAPIQREMAQTGTCVKTQLERMSAHFEKQEASEDAFGVMFASILIVSIDVGTAIDSAFEAEIDRAATALKSVKVSNMSLRAHLRRQAADLDALDKFPNFDSCQILTEWGENEYDGDYVPEAMKDLPVDLFDQNTKDAEKAARIEKKAVKWLKRGGATKKDFKRLAAAPFGGSAAETLTDFMGPFAEIFKGTDPGTGETVLAPFSLLR